MSTFIFYITNDLSYFNHSFKTIMYADDTTLYGNIEDFPSRSFEMNMNYNLQHLDNWFKFNKLLLKPKQN